MSSASNISQSRWEIARTQVVLLCCFFLLAALALGLNQDGALLLQFKYSIQSDPLAVLGGWNNDAGSPCSWNGVMCTAVPTALNSTSRVVALLLPNSKLLGSITPGLGLLEHLRYLDLSDNKLNGTLPASIFNNSELRLLNVANNEISGELPVFGGEGLASLRVLNLTGNALMGTVPANLAPLPNLTVIDLANNYLSGELPGGWLGRLGRLEHLDLSSNLINGSLPTDLGGQRLRYLNLSYNRVAGQIPPELAASIPANATVDLAFNNLSGEIPHGGVFASQKPTAFAGNTDLCGKPLNNLCVIPSTLFRPSNSTGEATMAPKSPPAFAAMPKDEHGAASASNGREQGGLRPAVIIAIAIGDLAGIGLLLGLFFYIYQVKKRNEDGIIGMKQENPPASLEAKGFSGFQCCLIKKGNEEESEETESSASSGVEADDGLHKGGGEEVGGRPLPPRLKQHMPVLVTVDGEPPLELETLLKASAYVLGASASSIVYKTVLDDGTAFAVRRIGESSAVDKLKDFDALVRGIARFRHPNILRLRGYYWGADEKLLIHDFAPCGSLASFSLSKKIGSPPLQLTLESRIRIARGVARGLAYLHERKTTHGKIKPSNILLDADMKPKIADFGLERLFSGDGGSRLSTSARLFGSKRDLSPAAVSVAEASPRASSSSVLAPAAAPYQAPELLKNLKPGAKCDVYSFGVLLLELLAGRAPWEAELGQWAAGFVAEERNRMIRMADPAVRGEVEGREEALLSCFKLGFACCVVAPNRRPCMKDVVQLLEKMIPFSSSSSSSVVG